MWPGRSLLWGFYFVICYLALSLIAGVFIAEGALHPARRSLSDKDQKQVEGITVDRGSEWANVSILAVDGVNLSAWSIRPHDRNGGAVILLHGLSDNRLGMIGYAKLLLVTVSAFSCLTLGPTEPAVATLQPADC